MTQANEPTRIAATQYPPTKAQPEAVEFGSVRYQDSFRWLEEDSEPALAWQGAQDAFTQAILGNLPAFSAFDERFEAVGESNIITAPTVAGERWFTRHVPDGQELSAVDMAESETGTRRRIFDLNAIRQDEPLALAAFVPSPDGRKAVLAWSAGGREESHVRIIDVDSGEVLVDGIAQQRPMYFTWLPDGSGVIYLALDSVIAGGPSIFRLLLASPGDATAEAVVVDHPVARPIACADGRHIVLAVDHLAPRLDYILDTQGDGGWQPFLKGVPGIFRGDILGENFIAITDDGAPRGRVVSIPLATPTLRSSWKEIVPASDAMLGAVMVTGGRIVLLDLVDAYARLRTFSADGAPEGEIALPGRGVVSSFSSFYMIFTMMEPFVQGRDGQLVFVFSTFGQSPALYSADVETRVAVPLTEPKRQIDVQVHDLAGTSADGTRIPYHLVAHADLDLSKPQPTVIYGYGGFNASVLPGWLGAEWDAWINAGGVVALAHLRGGGEFGTPWWEQGRLKLKQNSFNDVHAVAEDLIARGMTSTAQLGVIGGSNGGTMAAAVAVQRPDLYRASVSLVPVIDVLARVRDPITMVATLDYGDPLDPEMSRIIYDWSPYQSVRDDVTYPAMLIDCGSNDPRCPPWHSRKFAARLQQAHVGDNPILLRVRAEAGHGAVSKTQKSRQYAEILAFFADQLKLTV